MSKTHLKQPPKLFFGGCLRFGGVSQLSNARSLKNDQNRIGKFFFSIKKNCSFYQAEDGTSKWKVGSGYFLCSGWGSRFVQDTREDKRFEDHLFLTYLCAITAKTLWMKASCTTPDTRKEKLRTVHCLCLKCFF